MGIRPIDLFPPPVVGQRTSTVEMRRVDRRYVKVTGVRGGEGPLTLGHLAMLKWIREEKPYGRWAAAPLELPGGATVDDVVAALGVLVARHEGLRTLFTGEGEQLVQRVLQTCELPLDVYEHDDATAAALIEELFHRLRDGEFDLAEELPLRAAVAVRDGVLTTGAVVYSHVVVDLMSAELLGRQFTELAADPARRTVGPPLHQPLDQAAYERSPAGQRRLDTAVEYWGRHLRRLPQCTWATPRSEQPAAGATSGWLWSRAGALALPHITARIGASESMAVLAAICAVLARRTGLPRFPLPTLASNRTERRLRGYIGPLAADSLVPIDADAETYDEQVRRVGTAVLRAGRQAMVDDAKRVRIIDRIHYERGSWYGRDTTFNDASTFNDNAETSGPAGPAAGNPAPSTDPAEGAGNPGPSADPAEVRRALGESRVWWQDWPPISPLLAFRLMQKRGELVLGAIGHDRNRIPPAEIESLLRGIEQVLVAGAEGDFALSRIGELTGIEPMDRGDGWRLVDSSWVELAQAQRLLDETLDAAVKRVFAVPEDDGFRLVAYLVGGSVRTPRQAHAACVAAMPGRRTAMTPHRYVICADPPADPADPQAWARQPVLTAGDGR
ncbi:condensation domain-containing protein [Plantactinospora solaniradicis]|uniref:Condensation domain-containing protein n=1 Tax=Plantactinospora solaniradicis TaxID=1723736 RepID=A0ABW1KID1_9ACTN